MTDKYHFSTVKNDVSGSDFFWPHGARIIASESFGVATIKNRKAQIHINPRIMCRIEKTCRVKGKTVWRANDVLGVESESRSQN